MKVDKWPCPGCGADVDRGWWCPDCQYDQMREAEAIEYRERNAAHVEVPAGTVDRA